MQANPRKFQMITFGIGSTPVALRVHDNEIITGQTVVKLLGVCIDVLLNVIIMYRICGAGLVIR